MGWSGAHDIFNGVADVLIQTGVNSEAIRLTLLRLIRELQARDWDTEDESLDQFRDHPLIVSVFYAAEVGDSLDSLSAQRVTGRISSSMEPAAWLLSCEGPDGCGPVFQRLWSGSRADVARQHNEVLQAWADHDTTRHGAVGAEVDDWRLMRTES
jgi:hypothetical protein